MLQIRLLGQYDEKVIESLEKETEKNRPEGMTELFWQLERDGYCQSYAYKRIYYMAYLLQDKYIKFEIVEK